MRPGADLGATGMGRLGEIDWRHCYAGDGSVTLTGLGLMLGVMFGLAHAIYVYSVVGSSGTTDEACNHTAGIYAALWTLALWILFGTYLLLMWSIGAVLYLLFRWQRK